MIKTASVTSQFATCDLGQCVPLSEGTEVRIWLAFSILKVLCESEFQFCHHCLTLEVDVLKKYRVFKI